MENTHGREDSIKEAMVVAREKESLAKRGGWASEQNAVKPYANEESSKETGETQGEGQKHIFNNTEMNSKVTSNKRQESATVLRGKFPE